MTNRCAFLHYYGSTTPFIKMFKNINYVDVFDCGAAHHLIKKNKYWVVVNWGVKMVFPGTDLISLYYNHPSLIGLFTDKIYLHLFIKSLSLHNNMYPCYPIINKNFPKFSLEKGHPFIIMNRYTGDKIYVSSVKDFERANKSYKFNIQSDYKVYYRYMEGPLRKIVFCKWWDPNEPRGYRLEYVHEEYEPGDSKIVNVKNCKRKYIIEKKPDPDLLNLIHHVPLHFGSLDYLQFEMGPMPLELNSCPGVSLEPTRELLTKYFIEDCFMNGDIGCEDL